MKHKLGSRVRGIARDADEEVSVITKLTFRSPYRSGNATLETTGRKGQLPLHASFDAVIANGGTVTHHHAAGRDHRPWYGRQRPPLFAEALRAAPPISILNSRRSREGRPLLGIPRGPGVYRKPHPY